MTFTKLVWSTRAAIEYEKLVSYLSEEWGEKITLRASGDINRNVDRIFNNPEQFPFLIDGKSIKKCVVLPYMIILFREDKNAIIILSLFDTRQSPRKRKL